MEIKEYSSLTGNTRSKLKTKQDDNFHMLMGLMTEVGELTDIFKKSFAYGKEMDWVHVQEEMGDCFWYLSELCSINEFDIEGILDRNIKKLRTRYPDKFTSDKAINRNLDAERAVLEES